MIEVLKGVGILGGILLFFRGLYCASRSDGWRGGLWAVVACFGLLMIALGTVLMAVPTFFASVGSR